MKRINIIFLGLFIISLSMVTYAGSTTCFQYGDSIGISSVCMNRTIMTGTKINWSDILNPPSALGGGTTLPIANITNLLMSSYACSGTDRLSNVSILTTGISGVCSTTGAGSGSGTVLNATNPWLELINSGTNITWNETKANATFLRIPKSITCTGQDKLNNLTINSSGLFGECQGDVDTDTTGITSLSQGTNMVFSVNPITTTGTISLGSHTHSYTNLTDTLTSFGYANLTGTANLGYTNLTGTASIGYTNLTGTITLSTTNISSGTLDDARLSTNITNLKNGVTAIPVANLTAGTLGAGWTWNGNTITSSYIGSHTLNYLNLTGTITLTTSNISGSLSAWTNAINSSANNISGLNNSHWHSYANLTGSLSGFGYTNLTGTATLSYANLTGTANLGYTNLTGTASIGYVNLTGTASLTAANITSGNLNLSSTGIYTITNSSGMFFYSGGACKGYLMWNGTGMLLNASGC